MGGTNFILSERGGENPRYRWTSAEVGQFYCLISGSIWALCSPRLPFYRTLTWLQLQRLFHLEDHLGQNL